MPGPRFDQLYRSHDDTGLSLPPALSAPPVSIERAELRAGSKAVSGNSCSIMDFDALRNSHRQAIFTARLQGSLAVAAVFSGKRQDALSVVLCRHRPTGDAGRAGEFVGRAIAEPLAQGRLLARAVIAAPAAWARSSGEQYVRQHPLETAVPDIEGYATMLGSTLNGNPEDRIVVAPYMPQPSPDIGGDGVCGTLLVEARFADNLAAAGIYLDGALVTSASAAGA